jgi:hypothetical protein
LKGHIDSKGHKKRTKDEASRSKAVKYLTSLEQAGSDSPTSPKKPERLPPQSLDKMVLEGPFETATANKISTTISKSDIESLGRHKKDNVEYFRFEISNFIVQNNLPFSLCERLASFIQSLVHTHSNSTLLSFTANRKHVTGYISDAIAPLLKEKYFKILETSPFSISIDEGCAKGNVQYLAVNARFLPHTESVKTKTKLIGLIAMGTSSSGKTVFDEVYKLLFSDKEGAERRKQNFIGISTDATSAMISKKEAGATNRLLSQFEQLIVVHDYCHALNLVLEKSVLSFPEYYFTMVKKIVASFHIRPKRLLN